MASGMGQGSDEVLGKTYHRIAKVCKRTELSVIIKDRRLIKLLYHLLKDLRTDKILLVCQSNWPWFCKQNHPMRLGYLPNCVISILPLFGELIQTGLDLSY